MKTTIKIAKGTTFHAPYADGNPKWTVVRAVRRGVYECMAKDDLDWAGTRKLFVREEIVAAIRRAAAYDRMTDEHEAFYASLTPGQVVHYHNGFSEYVRCEVVRIDAPLVLDRFTSFKAGSNLLKPVALVGEWPGFHREYHVKRIREGSLFRPHATNIVENPASPKHVRFLADPSKMAALDLESEGSEACT